MKKFVTGFSLVLLAACSAEEIVPQPYLPTDAWDSYRHSLESAGLADTALGGDWIAASGRAVDQPVSVDVPYRERGEFDPTQAQAAGYRFAVTRGQRVEVELEFGSEPPARVFLDLYRLAEQAPPLHVASAEEASRRLAFEPRRDAEYLLRLQPELLRGGRYTLFVRTVEVLEFPVQDHDVSDIQSGFGAERDAGRRSHHGVDIFAPRNTPVLATSRARVRRVGEQKLGGNVIWLYDEERSLNLYYAHLESQAVEQGSWVQPGQVIGAVGNSGNARTTPTHLHFGVYARGEGPLDPGRFLRPPRQRSSALTADESLVGGWGVTGQAGGTLRQRPTRRSTAIGELVAGTPVRIWAATGGYYRVSVGGVGIGFVAAAQVSSPPTAAADLAGE